MIAAMPRINRYFNSSVLAHGGLQNAVLSLSTAFLGRFRGLSYPNVKTLLKQCVLAGLKCKANVKQM